MFRDLPGTPVADLPVLQLEGARLMMTSSEFFHVLEDVEIDPDAVRPARSRAVHVTTEDTMSQATDDTGHGGAASTLSSGWRRCTTSPHRRQRYLEILAQGGYVEAMEGLALSFNRANTEYVLRHADEFSSRVEMSLGNVRPLIPLNVDPPQHSKYRKLLDPLFAPKRMDEQEEDITRRVNGFIDTFIDRGECNFTEEFAELFPSSVFLGLMGLPEDEMRMFLDMRDGILHPEKEDPDALVDIGCAHEGDERHRRGDLRVLRQPRRRAHQASRPTTSSPASSRPRSTARS